jgi:serine/threonine protein kinase
MPELTKEKIDSLNLKLISYLKHLGGSTTTTYIAAGGSAAVFRINTDEGPRAMKVFDPTFYEGPAGEVERRRLGVQRRLIGHDCQSLVQTYKIEEAFGTAFIEMEFLEWPNLKGILAQVPDKQVQTLLNQLVSAARFLENLGIVHRDIKPENIHVSSDFSKLKLLDLGVARDIQAADGADAAITDHNNKRPFLATAQYSSPEYLCRLDEPNARLWKGLTIYQIGAVLHDLIMKSPVFQQEVSLDNKWLVAKAVLIKSPSFADGSPTRLASLKALAARCLVKDLDTRLRLVDWQDFTPEGSAPLARLKSRLQKQVNGEGAGIEIIEQQRRTLERNQHWEALIAKVRNSLIAICTTQLSMTTRDIPGIEYGRKLTFTFGPNLYLTTIIEGQWQEGYHDRKANIFLKASLHCYTEEDGLQATNLRIVCVTEIGTGIDEPSNSIIDKIASLLEAGLDNNDVGATKGQKILYP